MHADSISHDPRGAKSIIVSVEPLLVGVPEAGKILGVSAKSIRRMIAAGELPSVMVGGRRLLAVADLTTWAAALPREGGTRGVAPPTVGMVCDE